MECRQVTWWLMMSTLVFQFCCWSVHQCLLLWGNTSLFQKRRPAEVYSINFVCCISWGWSWATSDTSANKRTDDEAFGAELYIDAKKRFDSVDFHLALPLNKPTELFFEDIKWKCFSKFPYQIKCQMPSPSLPSGQSLGFNWKQRTERGAPYPQYFRISATSAVFYLLLLRKFQFWNCSVRV